MSLPHPDWLQPDWLRPDVRAFMSTRAGGVSRGEFESMNLGVAVGDDPAAVAENRARLQAALGAPAVFLRQVHGAEVLRLDRRWLHEAAPPADAAISTDPDLGVAIQVADCLPVLFAAPGAVGGAHAGWRGLAAGVLERTVASLCEAAACEPSQVQAWMGACIGPEAFEVGAEVRQACGGDPAAYRHQPNAAGEDRWRADLAALARERLQALGLGRVSGGGWCTVSEASRFFSYRRERLLGRESGRMVAAIRLLG
ncbi:MAG: peptidoglycan editing factor PgeF [Roseateles asaccharophilus]|jgi:YfiH family protein|uniref:peptidoglycan editing factor PgeF n=1 Tax=Roseateles asaccharophilus TaxID=582607 RepID=UPI003919D374